MASPPWDERLDAITERALGGDIEGAVLEARALIADAPTSHDAWLTLAMIFSSAARWHEAHEAFSRATALGARSIPAHLAWARALEQLGRLDAAADVLARTHELAPHDAAPLRELGAVHYQGGRYEEALAALERALERDPSDARATYAIGLCEEARRHPAAALAAYQRATALDPALTAARKTLADLLASLGEHEQAIRVLDELLRIERTNEQAAHNRDVLAKALRDMRAARLLGKDARAWEQCAVVQEGELQRREARATAEGGSEVRHANTLAELHVTFDAQGRAERASLVLIDPARAARKRDDSFKVTVVGSDGRQTAADYATAISLTFLREGLGIPMTQASAVYARALAETASLTIGGARIAFATLTARPGAATSAHGLTISLEPAEIETGARAPR